MVSRPALRRGWLKNPAWGGFNYAKNNIGDISRNNFFDKLWTDDQFWTRESC